MMTAAKILQYRHSSMAIHIAYDADRSIPQKIRDYAKELRSAHLNINQSLSRSTDRIILQSITGGTVVNITPYNTVLQTQYYNEYVQDESHDKRKSYALDKLSTVLDYLTAVGAQFSFCGLLSVARITLTENDLTKDALLRAAERAMGILTSFERLCPTHDFSIRVSKVDGGYFSNLTIQWFEERKKDFPISISGLSGSNVTSIQIAEWDMELVNQGIEVRWDYNNKSSLHAGKRDWTKNDYLEMFEKMFSTMPVILEDVRAKIQQQV